MRHTDDLARTPSPSDNDPPADAAEPYRDGPDDGAPAQLDAQSQVLAPRSATATGEPPAVGADGSTERLATDPEPTGWDVTWDPQPDHGEWTRTRPLPRVVAVPEQPDPHIAESESISDEPIGAVPPRRRQPWGLYALIGLLVALAGVFFG